MKIIEEFGFRRHHFAFGIHWLILRKCHLIFLSFRGLYFCALPIFSAGRVQRIEKKMSVLKATWKRRDLDLALRMRQFVF